VRHSNYRQSKEKNQHTDARKPSRGVWRRTSRRKAGGARGEKRPGHGLSKVSRRCVRGEKVAACESSKDPAGPELEKKLRRVGGKAGRGKERASRATATGTEQGDRGMHIFVSFFSFLVDSWHPCLCRVHVYLHVVK
jgi:hypothetical protein